MDPRYSAQDIIRCDLCEIHVVQSHCELCQVNLCKSCVGEHLSTSTKTHRVVPYKDIALTRKFPKCKMHSKICELFCEKCNIPVCSSCLTSGKHKGHHISDILQKLSTKRKDIEKELKELETIIFPKYEKIALGINTKKSNLETHYRKETAAVIKQGENLNRVIDIIVNKRKSEIDVVKNINLAALNKQENCITKITLEVQQTIVYLKKILQSSDIFAPSKIKSTNVKFRLLPLEVNVSLPIFSPWKISTKQLDQMFGSLSVFSISKEEHGRILDTPNVASSPTAKQLPVLEEPKIISTIYTGNSLHSVACFIDEEIWTSGNGCIMRLYNLHWNLLKSINSKSRNSPGDIAVMRNGALVYTDTNAKTINVVTKKKIEELIRFQGWKPDSVCSTSSGDLLVTMDSDDGENSKVVRYFGSTETQTIQFDDKGHSFYSYGHSKYICENRNMDICVSDYGASAVVVVNQAGKLRFRYTDSNALNFAPRGIATDSQSQILIADCENHCITILNQDGNLLSYINNCDVYLPFGICINSKDNLVLAELSSGVVKIIRYM
ncbi:E3 ubiquitin-protein ligase TRIM71-like [Saccostrea cucullata]|uniref:E3 ubiquitin-protein ligase TRIM71-like n=1 Tax=Saccostrea cuccullata TaxID=36930 RepID=UPI002ED3EB9A